MPEEQKVKKKSCCHRVTKPCRCFCGSISFPLGCLLFTVIYWLMLIPILYYVLEAVCLKNEARQCTWTAHWRYIFWTCTTLIWVIVISAAICCWSCRATKEYETKYYQKKGKNENDKLLNNTVKFDKSKRESLTDITIIQERKDEDPKVKSTKDDTVTLPIRRSVTLKEQFKDAIAEDGTKKQMESKKRHSLIEDVIKGDIPVESIAEEIDKMFPRCSTRRKQDFKKRPDTLIIHSPKYPKEVHDSKRFSVQERPTTASPLTPREIFFRDLIEGARKQTIARTQNFLENERKHSSNNFVNSKKPEIKDFILKSRPGTDASSPEYFIANVPNRNSCTAEVFLFVDGGQPQEALTICYIDQEDDVFKN